MLRPHAWRVARDELWSVLDRYLAPGASVAVVGAGNCDDLPLSRLARRADRVDLVDIDPVATRRAVRRAPRRLRAKLHALTEDVTAGGADRIVRDALEGRNAHCHGPPPEPLGAGNYDLVIGDLLYSQLLYPALLDCAVPRDVRERVLRDLGPRLTEAVVRRFHASTAGGLVVHLHDLAGWWHGIEQPLQPQRVLEMPTAAALRVPLALPLGCDPRKSLRVIGARILQTRLWRWPFCPGVDYLVCATVASASPEPA